MVLNAPYLPSNHLRPRAFGGSGADRTKKDIPASSKSLKAAARFLVPALCASFLPIALQPATETPTDPILLIDAGMHTARIEAPEISAETKAEKLP